jgi:selenocysteine-specific elongation factor
MRVIGTAGHVDHGKSTLVEALTGTHPDRLKEEREREMTIDLGFAWMDLPGGEEVGIVDVPGHRDFIENMLAGVGGIDAALFVVAADEGVMPQTREHLAILDLLQVQGGIVALTKIDLVNDLEWLDLVEDEIRQVISGTVLENAPIVRVSARSGEGIAEIAKAISECLAEKPERPDLEKPRLPVDRVFTIAGFGTIVTGTLLDGRLQIGDEVEILPQGRHGRVRGLQSHKKKEQVAIPASRTAVNITGISVDQIHRGDVLVHPGDYQASRRMDVYFRLLPDASQPLEHNTQVKLFIGSAEVMARVRLLGSEVLHPGEQGWLQLELRKPVVAVRGDHYILRKPSPGETLGGGSVVDPKPMGRHKRFAKEIIERLETLTQGSPTDVLLHSLLVSGISPLNQVVTLSNLDRNVAVEALNELIKSEQLIMIENQEGEIIIDSDKLVSGKGYWNQITSKAIQEVDRYHHAYPLRIGMPREELKSRLKIPAKWFNALLDKLVHNGALEESGPLVYMPGHQVRFTPQQDKTVEEFMVRFQSSPYAPPSIKETQAKIGEDLYNALVDLGRLVPVSPEVVFRRQDYDHMVEEVRRLLELNDSITAAQVRDHFNTSRRYALALLEYLDAIGITVRQGDVRHLKRSH